MELPSLVLASSSPRRAALLRALGIDVVIVAPLVDESMRAGEAPDAHAARLARDKAAVGSRQAATAKATRVVLGADTIVVAGEVLGKPAGAEEARAMLRRLAGTTHEVLTAVHLIRTDTGEDAGTVERTTVRFRAYDERWIEWYVASGEPFGKAGAYSIQGKGALLCAGIDGSWSNVVGLPLEALPGLFARVGVEFLGLAHHLAPGADNELGILSRDEGEVA